MNKFINSCSVIIFLVTTLVGPTHAEVQVSGLMSFVAGDANSSDVTNATFRNFSNFHTSRTRVFLDARLDNNTEAFFQLLIDNQSITVYGAYVRFNNVVENFLNIQAGFLPTTVGTYAARTYSNVNPLIGTPLLYNYHSSFAPMRQTPVGTIDNLLATRDTRGNGGLPVIYDACWNTGVEMYGGSGDFGYSVAALVGSVSKPLQQQLKNIPQFTSRLSYNMGPGLALGLSAYYGPYLIENMVSDPFPTGATASDYMSSGVGYDLYMARGYWEVYSEAFYTAWEYPALPDLKASSGYAEAKYKILPGWFVAGRYGWFVPETVRASNGSDQPWDYSIARYEFGAGRWLSRNILVKLVGQINRFADASQLDDEIIALQISVNLR